VGGDGGVATELGQDSLGKLLTELWEENKEQKKSG